jgi:Flp pilus assembly protein TadD
MSRGRVMGWAPWVALSLAIAYRIVYFIQIQRNPFLDSPIMDEGYHDLWAKEIAGGDWKARVPFYRAPLYPSLLGVAYSWLGTDPPPYNWVRGTQLLLGASSTLLIHRLGLLLLPNAPGLAAAAAVLTALDGLLLYFEADLLVESLLAPWATGFAILLLLAVRHGGWRRWLLVGLLLGAFSVTRPNLLAFAPFAFAGALVLPGAREPLRRLRWGSALAVTAGTCAFVLPVTAINAVVGGDRVLVAWHGGLNLFLGNNPEANGWSATAPGVLGIDWWGGYEDAIRIAEKAEGRTLRPSEVSDYWSHRALQWWREHPRAALELTAKKILFFCSGTEFFNNRHIRLFFEEFAPAGTPGLHLYHGVMPLAILGTVALWRRGDAGSRWIVLFAVVYALSVVAFFVTARYRAPLRPLLGLFAVVGAVGLGRVLRRGGPRAWATGLAALALGLVLNFHPWLASHQPSPAQFYQSLATIRHNQGRYPDALEWQLRAFDADSTYPESNLHLGTLFMLLDQPEKALEAFERERSLDPDDGRNLASLGQALARLGRWEESQRAYEASESTGFTDAPALYNHARSLERLGRFEDAATRYRRAVGIDSTFADAWNNLGVLAAKGQRWDEARSYWEKATAVRPGYEPALDNLRRLREMSGGDLQSTDDGG